AGSGRTGRAWNGRAESKGRSISSSGTRPIVHFSPRRTRRYTKEGPGGGGTFCPRDKYPGKRENIFMTWVLGAALFFFANTAGAQTLDELARRRYEVYNDTTSVLFP